ncbi:hypothetical protein HYV30_00355 [Candidatus Kaiserbacteria bacterium]|nr:hypothetical protein [Candidatus Kaiserbacteria bacterium]
MRRIAIIITILCIMAGAVLATVTLAAPKLHTERCAKGGEVIVRGDTLWTFAGKAWPGVLKDNPWMETEGRVIRKTADLTIVRIYPGEFVCGVTRKTAPKPVAAVVTAPPPAPAQPTTPNPNPQNGRTNMNWSDPTNLLLIAILLAVLGALLLAFLGRRRPDDEPMPMPHHGIAHHHDGTVRVVHEHGAQPAAAPAAPARAETVPAPAPVGQVIGDVPVPVVLTVRISGTPTGRDLLISSAVVSAVRQDQPAPAADGHVAAAPAR